jgi:hypothetical protein
MSMTMTFSDVRRAVGESTRPADSQRDHLIGSKLGHFEIIEPIGRGGMGQVYRALDTSLQRYVAVKVILTGSETGIDAESQSRLMYEAVAQARVNHPNIVTIYYVGRDAGTPFLAMELIDGQNASDLIQQGTVPYETLCSIAIRITHALDIASRTGIVHSDIKPQNLLILPDGNVKLSDFGMARIADRDEGKLLGGTPNYLAPELLRGEKPSLQSDMYALGVTLFELSFGRLPVPLSGSSLQEWSRIHETASVKFPEPWPDHLPDGWKKVLDQLLQKNPQDRFSSYEELGQTLRSILPVPRPRAGLFARTVAWCIDAGSILFATALPLALASTLLRVPEDIANLMFLPVLGLYLAIVYAWRQSLGRELIHVKIVNQYSLTPGRKVMVFRECLRMVFFCFVILGNLASFLVPLSQIPLLAVGVALTAADLLYAATWGRGQSLHDRLFRTKAVIGSPDG